MKYKCPLCGEILTEEEAESVSDMRLSVLQKMPLTWKALKPIEEEDNSIESCLR